MKAKRFIICSLLFSVSLIAALFFLNEDQKDTVTSVNAQVDSSFNEIMSEIDAAIVNNSDLAASSNPYDYYEHVDFAEIHRIGYAAIPALYARMEANPEQNGLEQYLLAICIEDVSRMTLRQLNYSWSTGSEWMQAFEKLSDNIEEEINDILDSDLSKRAKVDKILEFGVFSLAYIDQSSLETNILNELDVSNQSRSHIVEDISTLFGQ